jgi:UDP-N-acetylmuramate dehydrogenase
MLPGHSAGDGLVKVSLGWILDHILHVRGYREENVGTYIGQALVLVNHGDATAAELEAFVQNISAKIFEATDITVEREVTKLS